MVELHKVTDVWVNSELEIRVKGEEYTVIVRENRHETSSETSVGTDTVANKVARWILGYIGAKVGSWAWQELRQFLIGTMLWIAIEYARHCAPVEIRQPGVPPTKYESPASKDFVQPSAPAMKQR